MKYEKIGICLLCLALAVMMFTFGYVTGKSKPKDVIVLTTLPDTSLNAGSTTDSSGADSSRSVLSESAFKVNINTADKSELMELEGIGEVLADRIIEYRNKVGGFGSTEELMEINGIGSTTFEQIRDLVYIG